MSDRFVITGAAGFVGGALVRAFATRGEVVGMDVRAFDVRSRDVQCMEVDIARSLPDIDGFENATVIHTAAVMKAPDEGLFWRVNVDGTRNVLDWAARNRAKHVVFFSSGGVYGYGRGKHWKESDPLDPIGFYGYTKWIGENLTAMYSRLHGIPATVVRLFWPYGPGQKAGVFAFICRAVAEGTALTINRNGSPTMNPVHVADIVGAVQAMVLAGGGGKTYNLCGDESVSFLEAVRMFEKRLGKSAVCRFTQEDPGDLLGDNSLLKQELGWRPVERLCDLTHAMLPEEA